MSALTTLAAVKAYLGITTTGQDVLIPPLIARESALAEAWTGRTFPVVVSTNKRINGNGSKRLTLPETPIISISALSVDGATIPVSADSQQSGYMFDESTIYLIGYVFTKGAQNVVCSWVSGYETTETAYVPTGNTPTLAPTTGGTATTVVAVTDLTSGIPLSQVGSNPASNQFSFNSGTFTFNVAQYNHSVVMDYYYVPAPVEQAVIEMVGLDLQQRSNIGINSKSLANETVTYEKKGISDSAMEMLRPFRNIEVY